MPDDEALLHSLSGICCYGNDALVGVVSIAIQKDFSKAGP